MGNLALPLRIEGVEMRNSYYIPMRNLASIVPLVALTSFFGVLRTQQSQPQQSTMRAAAVESHEGVTISAQPWTDAALYKGKFPKRSPLSFGVVGIDTVIRNDSDESMKVNLDEIRLNVTIDEDNRQALQSLSADDVADLMSGANTRDPTKTHKLPLPIPTTGPGPKVGHDKKWTEMQKAAADAGVNSSIVAPHKSVEGLLYFDVQNQLDLLNSAHLYIPDIRALEKNQPLLYFEINLGR
jgi:hypothetical protein